MAIVLLGTKAAGSIVKLKENGVLVDYIVVHQGRPSDIYDASCDGTWLLRKDCYENRQWHSSNVNDYANSTIHSYLNSTFLNLFEANIRNAIKQVKLPYRAGSGYGTSVTSGANGLSAKIFLLSGYEMGWTSSDNSAFPADGAKLAYFDYDTGSTASNKRIANLNGSAVYWWLRSPYCYSSLGSTYSWFVRSNGNGGNGNCSFSYGIRPALILPSSLLVSDDGTVSTNTVPTTSGWITVPGQINGGSTITVSWAAATDAEGNLEGYIVERSTDGGSTWTQIYQGGATSTTNTVPFGTESVMYRVKAYDSEGLSSGYKTSGQVTVINNTAPTAPGAITVPETVFGGSSVEISWTASADGENNLAGYALERRVDDGAWTEIFRGDALAFTDAVTKGWLSVTYRVRAYDTENAYSGYTTADTRAVDNNAPPIITCAVPNGSDLGVKDEGFEVSYSVSDEDGDAVTVTESVDGAALRTFSAVEGEGNTLQLSGVEFMKLLNGPHTLAITASDDKMSAVHNLTFTKSVHALSVSLNPPMSADGPITVCVLSVSGSIPADAEYMVEVTNNALDDEPVWEDCTAAVRTGANFVFENETAENGFAFNFRVSVRRGASGLGGYITSVQGGFQ